MTQSKNLSVRKHSAGDAVVDGLLRGIVAGLAMAAVLIFAELLQGQPPESTLSRFGLNGPATPVAGACGALCGWPCDVGCLCRPGWLVSFTAWYCLRWARCYCGQPARRCLSCPR